MTAVAASPPTHPTHPDALADALARWRSTVDAELKGASFEKKLITQTAEGIALKPLYTRADLEGMADLKSRPGAAPYLRGVRPAGYKNQRWEVAQQVTGMTIADFNRTILSDLMHGQNAVVLKLDAATRGGLDPDEAPPAAVGDSGLSIATRQELGQALRGVDLTAVPVHVQAGSDATALAALWVASIRAAGTPLALLSGSLTADPLGAAANGGGMPNDLSDRFDSLAGWTRWAAFHVPKLRTIGVDTAMWSDAGASTVQELALAIATATDYLREMLRSGLSVESAAPRFAFSFGIGSQFFLEVAKFRAFRPLWTRVVTAFGAAPEVAGGATVSAATGRWNKTLLDPHVNLLRVTTEALSAVLGGCDQLHVMPFDEVSGSTTEVSRRIARNVHTLLAEEFNFAETADPAGGSWYVEKLTDELARAAWALFQQIEAKGGMKNALVAGLPQQWVTKVGAAKSDGIARRRVGLVGTNLFPNLRETSSVSAAVGNAERGQKRAVEFCKSRGNSPTFDRRPDDWPERFELAVQAAEQGATVGQLSRWLRPTSTAVERIETVSRGRAAEGFERLREASVAFARRTGARPKVFLAKMGPALQHKARADFSAGFFAVGGFEVVAKASFNFAEAAASAAVMSGALVVVLCSTDETYPSLVPVFARAVRAARAETTIVLAGLPVDPATATAFRADGIDEFIHVRAQVEDVLAGLLRKLGAL